MYLSLSLVARGEGCSFFKPSSAFLTMPFLSPSLAGRSKSTTGTLALARCAAICAPITPAPRTAAFLTFNLVTLFSCLTGCYGKFRLRESRRDHLAQGHLVQLAHAGTGQRGDETHLVGNRVAGNVAFLRELLDVGLDVVGRRALGHRVTPPLGR